MNTGNALAMSPSLVTKYMDAAKSISAHAVLLPDGIRFSRYSTRRDWTEEILKEIRSFYQSFTESGGAETVTQQGMALDKSRGGVLPLRRYLTASLSLRGGSSATSIDSVAKRDGLNTKYLTALVKLLNDTRPSPVLDDLRSHWRTATAADVDGLVKEISVWQQALWKFNSVGHIGKVNGPKSSMGGSQSHRRSPGISSEAHSHRRQQRSDDLSRRQQRGRWHQRRLRFMARAEAGYSRSATGSVT